jgi:cytochrome c oxidase subunit 1
VSTIGAGVIALSVIVFIVNVRRSLRSSERASDDPWDARTLEWSTSSPPPEYNFAAIPTVDSTDPFWYRKYVPDENGRLVRIPAGGADQSHGEHAQHIHMPSPSYYPAVVALGLPLIGFAALYGWWMAVVGGPVLLAGLFGWAAEPLSE